MNHDSGSCAVLASCEAFTPKGPSLALPVLPVLPAPSKCGSTSATTTTSASTSCVGIWIGSRSGEETLNYRSGIGIIVPILVTAGLVTAAPSRAADGSSRGALCLVRDGSRPRAHGDVSLAGYPPLRVLWLHPG